MGNDAIDYLNRDIVGVKHAVDQLTKIVIAGNGQPSLVQQVTVLREADSTTKAEISDLKKCIKDFTDLETEKGKRAWQFKVAILVALIGSFTSIIVSWQDHNTPAPIVTMNQNDDRINDLTAKINKLIEIRQYDAVTHKEEVTATEQLARDIKK